jgi:hypothetical protein
MWVAGVISQSQVQCFIISGHTATTVEKQSIHGHQQMWVYIQSFFICKIKSNDLWEGCISHPGLLHHTPFDIWNSYYNLGIKHIFCSKVTFYQKKKK